MNCPKCGATMDKVTFEGIEVDRCTDCKGLWFDSLEHEKLKRLPGADAIDTGDTKEGQQQNEIGDIDCPKCSASMVKMVDARQPHIWYEMCSTCGGVYFDAGEITDFKYDSPRDLLMRLFAKRRD